MLYLYPAVISKINNSQTLKSETNAIIYILKTCIQIKYLQTDAPNANNLELDERCHVYICGNSATIATLENIRLEILIGIIWICCSTTSATASNLNLNLSTTFI